MEYAKVGVVAFSSLRWVNTIFDSVSISIVVVSLGAIIAQTSLGFFGLQLDVDVLFVSKKCFVFVTFPA